MNKELMDFLNKNTNYNFGYVATDLYVNEQGNLESVFNHTSEQGEGLRQRIVLYGIESSRHNNVTSTITILENNETYDLLELGVLKLKQVSEDEVKKHMLYKDYINRKENILIKNEELPTYMEILNDKGIKLGEEK